MSPIINLQRKLTEVGRIRLGEKSEKGAPTKLDRFRLTSKSKEALEAAAAVYGGTVKAWKSVDGDAFELVTDTNVLDVVIPPGNALSQWYEMWSGAGCQRRCDGQTETIGNRPCLCPADQSQRAELSSRGQACRPTTRLSVILPSVKSVGIWRLESHGYYAATELAGIAELLQQVSATDKYLPATLRLEQRSARRNGKLSRFAVPVLEVGATVQEAIQAAAGNSSPAIEYKSSVSKPVEIAEPEFDDTPIVVTPVEPEPTPVIITETDDLGWEEPTFDEPIIVEPEIIVQNVEPVVQERKPLNHVMRIQILRRELDLSEEQYRNTLQKDFGVSSSKDLTPEQAVQVIERMTLALAKKKGN